MRLVLVDAAADYRLVGRLFCAADDFRTGQRHWQGYCRLMQRGVLLLLVLVCLTTGCTGSRAREQATVAVPPAPESIAVNRASSTKAKLSTPPRNKARAPVTAVKPVAAPSPAPQQQGEEQEGRIF